MLEQRTALIAARHVKPLAQGELSKLCGLYSILNAMQLALYPRSVSRMELQKLYLHGIEHLSRHRQLKRVLSFGMSEEVWLPLWQALASRANADFGTNLVCMPVLRGNARNNLGKALQAIAGELESGSPVLACFGDALDHLTVISGCTERRILFFDSSDLRWVEVHNVSLRQGQKRHWLSQSSVIAVVDDW